MQPTGFCKLFLGIRQCDAKFLFLRRGHLIHGIYHDGFYDRTQAASSQLVLDCFVYNEIEDFIIERELHAIHGKELDILFDNGIARLYEYAP